MIPVKEAAFKIGKASQTVRAWLKRDQGQKIVSGKRDGILHVDLPSLTTYANQKEIQYSARSARRYKTLAELEQSSCPTCGGTDWKRESGYNNLKGGKDVSVAMYCGNQACGKKWTARLPIGQLKSRNVVEARHKNGPDSLDRVKADRSKIVGWLMDDGSDLRSILTAFSPNLKSEVVAYYIQLRRSRRLYRCQYIGCQNRFQKDFSTSGGRRKKYCSNRCRTRSFTRNHRTRTALGVYPYEV